MTKKRSKRERRPNRRAKRILEQARLKARVIVAEASAETSDARITALAEAQAEAARIRTEAERSALQAVEQAHTEAGWILTQTRQFAQAESRALTAEAQLGAERLRVSAAAAVEQMRREALTDREQALREAATERARMRDEALLDAARLRDDARTEATDFLARLDAERETILDAARERARVILARADDARADDTRADDARADDARADREILAFLDAEADEAAAATRTSPPALAFVPVPVADDRRHADVGATPPPVGQLADLETVALFAPDEPDPPAAEASGTSLIWDTERAAGPGSADWTLEPWPEGKREDESEFWSPNPAEPKRRGSRWRRSGAGRA